MMSWREKVQVGDCIDVMQFGSWLPARVLDTTEDKIRLEVHQGWGKWKFWTFRFSPSIQPFSTKANKLLEDGESLMVTPTTTGAPSTELELSRIIMSLAEEELLVESQGCCSLTVDEEEESCDDEPSAVTNNNENGHQDLCSNFANGGKKKMSRPKKNVEGFPSISLMNNSGNDGHQIKRRNEISKVSSLSAGGICNSKSIPAAPKSLFPKQIPFLSPSSKNKFDGRKCSEENGGDDYILWWCSSKKDSTKPSSHLQSDFTLHHDDLERQHSSTKNNLDDEKNENSSSRKIVVSSSSIFSQKREGSSTTDTTTAVVGDISSHLSLSAKSSSGCSAWVTMSCGSSNLDNGGKRERKIEMGNTFGGKSSPFTLTESTKATKKENSNSKELDKMEQYKLDVTAEQKSDAEIQKEEQSHIIGQKKKEKRVHSVIFDDDNSVITKKKTCYNNITHDKVIKNNSKKKNTNYENIIVPEGQDSEQHISKTKSIAKGIAKCNWEGKDGTTFTCENAGLSNNRDKMRAGFVLRSNRALLQDLLGRVWHPQSELPKSKQEQQISKAPLLQAVHNKEKGGHVNGSSNDPEVVESNRGERGERCPLPTLATSPLLEAPSTPKRQGCPGCTHWQAVAADLGGEVRRLRRLLLHFALLRGGAGGGGSGSDSSSINLFSTGAPGSSGVDLSTVAPAWKGAKPLTTSSTEEGRGSNSTSTVSFNQSQVEGVAKDHQRSTKKEWQEAPS